MCTLERNRADKRGAEARDIDIKGWYKSHTSNSSRVSYELCVVRKSVASSSFPPLPSFKHAALDTHTQQAMQATWRCRGVDG